ncbi:hypothetical protein HDF16_000080 [Granulicella aggregans]|uniref:Uncharacterized protein n=1 Tax=Granulicella aggregans TaxID=474949 RepID=A0A7W8E1K9_9BACT|nr:hypothetical protein [Granulicella aggregans]
MFAIRHFMIATILLTTASMPLTVTAQTAAKPDP